MIGPLGSSDRRVIQNQYVQNLGKIAKQCNLSPVTIKKVLASTHAAGSNKITTHELAERMGSTVRNANRIIQNLEMEESRSSLIRRRPMRRGGRLRCMSWILISKDIFKFANL